jgi:hypothetical protein
VNPDLLTHVAASLKRGKRYCTHFNDEDQLPSAERSEQVICLALLVCASRDIVFGLN